MVRRALAVPCLVLVIACDHRVPSEPAIPPPENRPPTAVLRAASQQQEGNSVGFTADRSEDPDGDSLYYSWAWGDGTALTTTYPHQHHIYGDNGDYTVVLTVTDIHGASATASVHVTILNAVPLIRSADLSTPRMPHPVPMPATLSVRFEDQGSADNPIATIDWGDGTISQDTVHIYRMPGVYLTKVTVTDKDGAAASLQLNDPVWVYDAEQGHAVPGYEVIDLGSLGGDRTWPLALNNRGEVVGSSTTPADTAHAFLWREGALMDINPPGHPTGAAGAINDAGWIAGSSMNDRFYSEQGKMPIWRDGAFVGFVSVPRTEFGATPVRVGESGNVVMNAHGHEFPDAILARDGTAIELGGLISWAKDMNAHEQVVGVVGVRSIGPQSYERHAFLWEDGVMKDLGSIGTAPCIHYPERQCGHSEAYDINDRGQIVGSSFDGRILRAVLWDPTDLTPRDLEFGSGSSRAAAINENGQIAGDSEESGEAFLYENGAVVTLGTLGGGWTRVVDMNEQGTVVGTSASPSGEVHAFVWTRATGMRDLGPGPFGTTGVGSVAVAINDRGDILGYAIPCATTYRGSCNGWRPMRAILWKRTN